MSDTDLELLITLDDPPYEPEEDRFDHHQSEDANITPKALANFSPEFERSENPGE